MRICDNRYQRDRLRFDVAVKFIEREARTHTIRDWTGLSDDRIRKLYHSYVEETGGSVVRHRGKSPSLCAHYLVTPRIRQDAAWLASTCLLTGLLSPTLEPQPPWRLPDVQRAELLYQTFDVYQALAAAPAINFERMIFLVQALMRRDELAVGRCGICSAILVVDRFSLGPPQCFVCGGGSRRIWNADRSSCAIPKP